MTYKDNQPTFNVNRKVVNFKDFGTDKEKLKKANLQSKPNSEDQQHIGNKRTEYNPVTHKLTDYSDDEIRDRLNDMEEETNEGIFSDRYNDSNEVRVIYRIKGFSEFDNIDESWSLLGGSDGNEFVDTMTDRDKRTVDALVKKRELDSKYTGTAQGDIDVPWWRIGKLKDKFIEQEKKMKSLVANERQRLADETLRYDICSALTDFWKGKQMSQEDTHAVESLKSRMSQSHIQTPKKEQLIQKIANVYYSYIKKASADKLSKYEGDGVARFEKGVVGALKDIIRGKSSDPRETKPVAIEDFKPVKPDPINPKVMSRIKEYEAKRKEIDDNLSASNQKDRERLRR